MKAPAPSGPVKRSKRLYVYWGVALFLLLALGTFCWLVVVPVWQVHAALDWKMTYMPVSSTWGPGNDFDGKNRKAARESIRKLGGASMAARRVAKYGQMPEWIASRREQATWVLAECGADAVPLLLDALPRLAPEDKWSVGMAINLMQGNDEAGRQFVLELESSDSERRYWAAAALGSMFYNAAEKPLRKLLKDESARVRTRAQESLEMIGVKVNQ